MWCNFDDGSVVLLWDFCLRTFRICFLCTTCWLVVAIKVLVGRYWSIPGTNGSRGVGRCRYPFDTMGVRYRIGELIYRRG